MVAPMDLLSGYGLGSFIAEYRPRDAVLVSRLLVAIALTTLGVFTLFRWSTGGRVPVVAIGLTLLGIGLDAAYSAASGFKWRVLVFEHGLVDIRRGKHTVVRWDEVVTVQKRVSRLVYGPLSTLLFDLLVAIPLLLLSGTTRVDTYIIRKNIGTKHSFTVPLKDLDQLGDTIQREVTKRLLADSFATLEGGGTLSFGNLSLSDQGLTWGTKTISWDEVVSVEVGEERITVETEGRIFPWIFVRISKVPNAVLLQVLSDLFMGKRPSELNGE